MIAKSAKIVLVYEENEHGPSPVRLKSHSIKIRDSVPPFLARAQVLYEQGTVVSSLRES